VKLGIANVRALKGGYNGWVAAGNPVVRGDKPK
jgi:rhodanese-related sulfurtransferase